MRDLEIRVGGLEIVGSPRDSSRPTGFIVQQDGLQGWQGLPSGRREALTRAVEHGEHDVPVFLPSRVVTVDGWVLADSAQELGHMGDKIVGLGATGDRLRVTVDMHDAPRWADGRRISSEFTDSGSRRNGAFYGTFQLQFVFADPRKYGDENVWPKTDTATSISVAHYGNFPAYPLIEIPSAPSSYSIASPLGTYTITGATAGGTHTVDLRRGRVFRNGVEMFDVGRGNLWTVAPGLPLLHTLSVPGRVRINDTYV